MQLADIKAGQRVMWKGRPCVVMRASEGVGTGTLLKFFQRSASGHYSVRYSRARHTDIALDTEA